MSTQMDIWDCRYRVYDKEPDKHEVMKGILINNKYKKNYHSDPIKTIPPVVKVETPIPIVKDNKIKELLIKINRLTTELLVVQKELILMNS